MENFTYRFSKLRLNEQITPSVQSFKIRLICPNPKANTTRRRLWKKAAPLTITKIERQAKSIHFRSKNSRRGAHRTAVKHDRPVSYFPLPVQLAKEARRSVDGSSSTHNGSK